tara:strand:+ start:13 stop:567 length:555 start_codon:yes stop_codon:yes gene_type:complete
MNKYFAEFIGTFILVSVILNFPSDNPIFALAVGLTLAVSIFLAGKFSGGHFNPAVSIAKYINGEISSTDVILYPLSQIIGGLVAYLLHSGGKGIMKSQPDVAVTPVVLSDDAVLEPPATVSQEAPVEAPVEAPMAEEVPEVNEVEAPGLEAPGLEAPEPQGLEEKTGGYGLTLMNDLDNQPIFG